MKSVLNKYCIFGKFEIMYLDEKKFVCMLSRIKLNCWFSERKWSWLYIVFEVEKKMKFVCV